MVPAVSHARIRLCAALLARCHSHHHSSPLRRRRHFPSLDHGDRLYHTHLSHGGAALILHRSPTWTADDVSSSSWCSWAVLAQASWARAGGAAGVAVESRSCSDRLLRGWRPRWAGS